jgi:hypothetical protein
MLNTRLGSPNNLTACFDLQIVLVAGSTQGQCDGLQAGETAGSGSRGDSPTSGSFTSDLMSIQAQVVQSQVTAAATFGKTCVFHSLHSPCVASGACKPQSPARMQPCSLGHVANTCGEIIDGALMSKLTWPGVRYDEIVLCWF